MTPESDPSPEYPKASAPDKETDSSRDELAALKAWVQELQARMDQMSMQSSQSDMSMGQEPVLGGQDVPEWIPGGAGTGKHSFKVTKGSGLNVDVAAGKVYGGTSANMPYSVAGASFTLANGTNSIYLRITIDADSITLSLPSVVTDVDISGESVSSVAVEEWTHFVSAVSLLSGTSVPTDTFTHQDPASGYRYVEVATVTCASGRVTEIVQHLSGDYTEAADGQTWQVESS